MEFNDHKTTETTTTDTQDIGYLIFRIQEMLQLFTDENNSSNNLVQISEKIQKVKILGAVKGYPRIEELATHTSLALQNVLKYSENVRQDFEAEIQYFLTALKFVAPESESFTGFELSENKIHNPEFEKIFQPAGDEPASENIDNTKIPEDSDRLLSHSENDELGVDDESVDFEGGYSFDQLIDKARDEAVNESGNDFENFDWENGPDANHLQEILAHVNEIKSLGLNEGNENIVNLALNTSFALYNILKYNKFDNDEIEAEYQYLLTAIKKLSVQNRNTQTEEIAANENEFENLLDEASSDSESLLKEGTEQETSELDAIFDEVENIFSDNESVELQDFNLDSAPGDDFFSELSIENEDKAEDGLFTSLLEEDSDNEENENAVKDIFPEFEDSPDNVSKELEFPNVFSNLDEDGNSSEPDEDSLFNEGNTIAEQFWEEADASENFKEEESELAEPREDDESRTDESVEAVDGSADDENSHDELNASLRESRDEIEIQDKSDSATDSNLEPEPTEESEIQNDDSGLELEIEEVDHIDQPFEACDISFDETDDQHSAESFHESEIQSEDVERIEQEAIQSEKKSEAEQDDIQTEDEGQVQEQSVRTDEAEGPRADSEVLQDAEEKLGGAESVVNSDSMNISPADNSAAPIAVVDEPIDEKATEKSDTADVNTAKEASYSEPDTTKPQQELNQECTEEREFVFDEDLKPDNSAIGLDISNTALKVVVLKKKDGAINLIHWRIYDLDPNESENQRQENIKNIWERFLSSYKQLKKLPVVTSLINNSILIRYLELPYMSDANFIKSAALEIQSEIFFPEDQVKIITHPYQVLDTKNTKRKTGLLLAIENQIIEQILILIKNANIKISKICLDSFAMIQYCGREDDSARAIIDLGADKVKLVIVKNREIRLARNIDSYEKSITTEIAEYMGVNFIGAEGLKRQLRFSAGDEKNKKFKLSLPYEGQGNIQNVAFPFYSKLSDEIQLTLQYYNSNNPEKVERVELMGGGALVEGIDKFLTFTLNLPVTVADIKSSVVVRHSGLGADVFRSVSPKLAIAIGLAWSQLEPLELLEKIDLRKKYKIKKTTFKLSYAKLLIPLVALIALTFGVQTFFKIQTTRYEKNMERKKELAKEMTLAIESLKEFEELKGKLDTQIQNIKSLKLHQPRWSRVLKILSQNTPESLWLTQFTGKFETVIAEEKESEGLDFSDEAANETAEKVNNNQYYLNLSLIGQATEQYRIQDFISSVEKDNSYRSIHFSKIINQEVPSNNYTKFEADGKVDISGINK